MYFGRKERKMANIILCNHCPLFQTTLPELETPESERLRNFVFWLQNQRPFHSPLKIIR